MVGASEPAPAPAPLSAPDPTNLTLPSLFVPLHVLPALAPPHVTMDTEREVGDHSIVNLSLTLTPSLLYYTPY